MVDFMAQLENISVESDQRAKVVINERTGTLVAGGDVRIAKVAISHGDLKLTVTTETTVSQPMFVGRTGSGVQTALVTNSKLDVAEPASASYVSSGNTVADLVQTLSRLKISTRDMISILRAVKAAGALHAELIVQ
jgi:flagellar P-ring protein precursor FlgI